jgi:hypothetical protein
VDDFFGVEFFSHVHTMKGWAVSSSKCNG